MVRETQHNIDEFVSFAKEILQQAGSIAMQHYGKGREGTRFDEDLLTEAELKINEYFEATLTARYPEHRIFWNDRQQTEYSHGENRYLWVFDSIDGADNFQAGIPIWGTSLALLENFWPVLGMFLMPATGDFFHARAGGTAFRGEQQIHISQRETIDNESLLFTYSRFHHHYKSHFPGKHRDLGCAAAHVCYIAMGRGDAAVI